MVLLDKTMISIVPLPMENATLLWSIGLLLRNVDKILCGDASLGAEIRTKETVGLVEKAEIFAYTIAWI